MKVALESTSQIVELLMAQYQRLIAAEELLEGFLSSWRRAHPFDNPNTQSPPALVDALDRIRQAQDETLEAVGRCYARADEKGDDG